MVISVLPIDHVGDTVTKSLFGSASHGPMVSTITLKDSLDLPGASIEVGVTFNVTISSFSFSDSHDAKLNAAERPRVRKKIFSEFHTCQFYVL